MVSTKAKTKVTAKTKSTLATEPRVVKPKPNPIFDKTMKDIKDRMVMPNDEEVVGKCASCNEDLEKLLFDSSAKKPQYVVTCNNKECSQYRFMIPWQAKK